MATAQLFPSQSGLLVPTKQCFSCNEVPSADGPLDIVRPLDATETFWNSFHKVGNVMILSVISIISSHEVHVDQLREAAEVLARRHQVLRCSVMPDARNRTSKEKKTRMWRRSSSVNSSPGEETSDDLGQCSWVEREAKVDCALSRVNGHNGAPSNLDWLEAMAKEQKTAFNLTEGPLWRVRMLPPARLLLNSEVETPSVDVGAKPRYRIYLFGCFHHAIMDGLSRQRFWNELCCALSAISRRDLHLNRYATVDANNFQQVVVPVCEPPLPQTRFPDAVQEFVPPNMVMSLLKPLFPLGYSATFLVNGQRKILSPLRNPFSFCFPKRFGDPVVTSHTSIIPLWIPSEITSKLQKKAKVLKITVNGVITAVAALAMARLIWQRKQIIQRLDSERKAESTAAQLKDSTTLSPDSQSVCSDSVNSDNVATAASEISGAIYDEASSPFVAHNPNDIDRFPLPIHTPAHVARKCYTPWEHALRPTNSPRHVVKTPYAASKKRRVRVSMLRGRRKPASARRSFTLPLHINAMQAISCRRWLPAYSEADAKKGTERYLDYLQKRFSETVMVSRAAPVTPEPLASGNSGPALTKEHLVVYRSNKMAEENSRYDSVTTEASNACSDNSLDSFSSSEAGEPGLCEAMPEATLQFTRGVSCNAVDANGSHDSTTVPARLHRSVTFGGHEQRLEEEEIESTTVAPGLGSYAILMPQSVWVNRSCEVDKRFWKFAKAASKDVHKRVDRKCPTAATLNWQIMSGFIKGASCKPSVLRRLASPHPRPSSFMISNGGRWDDSPVEQLLSSLNEINCEELGGHTGHADEKGSGRGKVGETPRVYFKIESSWSCVAQHQAGVNMFCHNVVTLGGRMCWSLQYHTNITNKRLATEYGQQILQIINELVK